MNDMKTLKEEFEMVVAKRRDSIGCSTFTGEIAILHRYARELEKQNEELIITLKNNIIECCMDCMSVDSFDKVECDFRFCNSIVIAKNKLEQIKQKPIEELLKEV